jgi:hypothetical protein
MRISAARDSVAHLRPRRGATRSASVSSERVEVMALPFILVSAALKLGRKMGAKLGSNGRKSRDAG